MVEISPQYGITVFVTVEAPAGLLGICHPAPNMLVMRGSHSQ